MAPLRSASSSRPSGVGAVTGLVGAALLWVLLRARRFEAALEATATLAIVLLAVAVASEIREDAGLVTAIVMGVVLAHRQREISSAPPPSAEILVGLLLGVLFVILSARVDPDAVLDLGAEGLAFVALLVLVVRPISVAVCTLGTSLTGAERALIAWMMPRGIVAAATVSAFESDLKQARHPGRGAARARDLPGDRGDRGHLRAHGTAARAAPRRCPALREWAVPGSNRRPHACKACALPLS